MIKKNLQDALNEQINKEMYSGYLYLGMSAHLAEANLSGFANWMRVQFKEEQAHAMKLFEYLLDRGGRVTLKAIDAPPATFGSPLAVFQQALEHEKKVTGLIHKLYELAEKEKDHALAGELQWFIKEQVEEEKNATEIVENLKRAGAQVSALMFLDGRLGQRPG
jgi:ferritin